MYHLHVVADDYPVRAEGVISREIAKKENLEEMAITTSNNRESTKRLSKIVNEETECRAVRRKQ